MSHQYVGNYECGECGHERTMKMRVKIGSFEEQCDECDAEATFSATMDPMDIEKFGEELVPR